MRFKVEVEHKMIETYEYEVEAKSKKEAEQKIYESDLMTPSNPDEEVGKEIDDVKLISYEPFANAGLDFNIRMIKKEAQNND